MSSEPHFPLAPWFLSPKHTALWTEMEVLQRRVAFSWELDKLQLSLEQKLLQTSCPPAKPRSPCLLAGLHNLDNCPDQQHQPQ